MTHISQLPHTTVVEPFSLQVLSTEQIKTHSYINGYWPSISATECCRSPSAHKAAFPRAKFLCHISHALQSLLTDFCGIITVNLYSRADTDAKWINNNYNFGINDCRACNLWQRKFGRVLEP